MNSLDRARGLHAENERRRRAAAEMDAAIAAAILATGITTPGAIRLTVTDLRILRRRAYQPDLSWSEIAGLLGLSKNQVTGRFRRRKAEWLALKEREDRP